MNIKPHRQDNPCSTLTPQRWPRVRILNDVYELNARVLETLSHQVVSGASTSISVVAENAELWGTLDASARMRVAQMPVLFLDLRFQDELWWQEVATGTACKVIQQGTSVAQDDQWVAHLTRQALILAWPAVREDRSAAILLFGISEGVANVIASLAPQQLDYVSSYHSHEMRLRWSRSHGFWRKMLTAAQSGDTVRLRELHLCGLQMIGGELIRTRTESVTGKCSGNGKRTGALLSPVNS
jgi:hypothetical protein